MRGPALDQPQALQLLDVGDQLLPYLLLRRGRQRGDFRNRLFE
jgi:hypothetical protein